VGSDLVEEENVGGREVAFERGGAGRALYPITETLVSCGRQEQSLAWIEIVGAPLFERLEGGLDEDAAAQVQDGGPRRRLVDNVVRAYVLQVFEVREVLDVFERGPQRTRETKSRRRGV